MLLEQLKSWLVKNKKGTEFFNNIDDMDELFHVRSSDNVKIANIMWPKIVSLKENFCIPSERSLLELRQVFKQLFKSLDIHLPFDEHPDLTFGP